MRKTQKTPSRSSSPSGRQFARGRSTRRQVESGSGPSQRSERVSKAFLELWARLFSTPVHLDSSLSKLPVGLKSILAQILPRILLRPVSEAEGFGVGVLPGEPWNLESVADWRPAAQMAARLYAHLQTALPEPAPVSEDYPPEMVAAWQRDWGAAVAAELVDTLARPAPLSLRASQKLGAAALLAGLTEKGPLPVRSELSLWVPQGVRLQSYVPVLQHPLYEKGLFEIQDEGSQYMALLALWPDRYEGLLSDRPGRLRVVESPAPPIPKDLPRLPEVKGDGPLTVVDACSGAGGKALAMADALRGRGRVYAYDISAVKLQALKRRATRAQLTNIQTLALEEGEEGKKLQPFFGKASIVLVDAPCSGWGVLRRNPDIKWRQKSESLTRLVDLQKRLLELYAQLVAPGGRLVYGVCTFRPEETVQVVEAFLRQHPEFTPAQGGYAGPGPCDGFFMQVFHRTG
jgi:16S rRNA C967 or C1407 C5-methylase (RsmB/RsmF family)